IDGKPVGSIPYKESPGRTMSKCASLTRKTAAELAAWRGNWPLNASVNSRKCRSCSAVTRDAAAPTDSAAAKCVAMPASLRLGQVGERVGLLDGGDTDGIDDGLVGVVVGAGEVAERVGDERRAVAVGIGLDHRAHLHAGREGGAQDVGVVEQSAARDEQSGLP